MLKFALKNMAIKRVQIILVVLSIVISAGIGVLAYNVSSQVKDGVTENSRSYSLIIGSQGSKTQLVMNSIYFTDTPLDNIPYSFVEELSRDSRTSVVVPFAMADSYNGSNVIGTSSEYLDGYSVKQGEIFDNFSSFKAVVGYNVAKRNSLKVGDIIHTSHSATHIHDGENEGIEIVGILNETHSAYDNAVFTHITTLWHLHGIGEHEEAEQTASLLSAEQTPPPSHDHIQDGETSGDGNEDSNEENSNEHKKTVCAILVNARSLSAAQELADKYNGQVSLDGEMYFLQAVNPDDAIRSVLNDADNTQAIVFVLCAVILIMNIMIISIITLLNMYHSSKEISLMRIIGISTFKINLLYIIQNSIIGLVSVLLAFGVSRICLLFMNDFVASWGIVINIGKIYPLEIVILLGVFIISILPTAICTVVMSRKDSLNG